MRALYCFVNITIDVFVMIGMNVVVWLTCVLNLEVLSSKRAGFVRLARPLFKWNDEGIVRVIPRKKNGHPVFISGRTNHQASFKNNTFINILKHFQK